VPPAFRFVAMSPSLSTHGRPSTDRQHTRHYTIRDTDIF
jgi:hypothetical protein